MGCMITQRSSSVLRGLPYQVQTIAREVEKPISPKKYEVLFDRLNRAFEMILAQKDANPFLESLKGRCVDLYQKLEDGSVEWEISQIQREALALKKGNSSSQAIRQLETHIRDLLKNHAPSQEQNRILNEAKRTLNQAKGVPVLSHFEFLSQQQDVRFLEDFELISSEIEEIFDIAKNLYDKNVRKAKIHFEMLPEKYKSRFEAHMRFLCAQPFVDAFETMQALLAMAHDTEFYPSQEEIDLLFLGLSQVNAEESVYEKRASFASFMM